MTSEIKVDTISEQTSANGVTIDGLTIKDGNIIGDVALAGTTPTFTVGDGGAEDAALIFDGNAVDYYMALDDSADNLIIGSGSTVGSNSLITIDSDGDFTLDVTGGIVLDGDDSGTISFKDGGTRYGLVQKASDNFEIQSMISDGDIVFKGSDSGSVITALTLDMSAAGKATFNNDIALGDSQKAVFGASEDLQIYHDGSNSYITDTGTGGLYLKANADFVVQSQGSDENMIYGASNAFVKLYHNGSEKLATASTGVDVTGTVTATSSLIATGLLNTVNNSLLIIGGGNAGNVGSNLTMYGGADGSAGLFRFRNATTVTANITATGQIQGYSLGPSSPTFSFTTDTDTGMTRPTTDTLTLVTAGAEAMRITSGQTISTGGEASPDVGAGGLGLDQNALDNNIFTLKSSDVSHTFTNIDEADTYFAIQKFDTNGGTEIKSFRAGNSALEFNAYCGDESDTKSTQATAAMRFNMALTNGSTGANPISSNDNLCTWHNDGSAKMILDAEGDLHLDGSTAAYDAYEDAQLVRAFDLSHGRGVIDSKFDKFISYNHEKLADMKLVGREEDGTPNHFINVTGMQRLHNGAIWQQYEKHQKLASAFYKLAEKTIGKEEADKLLTEEEIQLLN